MNKKLIAAAVVAGLAAPMAAQADVSVYGVAQLELVNSKLGTADGKNTITDSKNSRVGVRWSEDLGEGLKALGEFEFAPDLLDANTNNAGTYARQAWLGLKGGFGEFQVGTVLQPYKYSGGVKYDAFVATAAEARSNHGGMISSAFGAGGYFANALAYKNKFGNVSFWAAYSPEEATDAGNKYPGAKGDLMASLVFGFNGGEVGVAYAKNNNATGTTGPEGEKNTKIFGKYSFGQSTVLAQYEQQTVTSTADSKVMFLAYQFKMGMNTLIAQVGNTNYDDATADVKYYALGAQHHFSKHTYGFIAYMNKNSDNDAADLKNITIGLTEKF